jgi:hypothetical protein
LVFGFSVFLAIERHLVVLLEIGRQFTPAAAASLSQVRPGELALRRSPGEELVVEGLHHFAQGNGDAMNVDTHGHAVVCVPVPNSTLHSVYVRELVAHLN